MNGNCSSINPYRLKQASKISRQQAKRNHGRERRHAHKSIPNSISTATKRSQKSSMRCNSALFSAKTSQRRPDFQASSTAKGNPDTEHPRMRIHPYTIKLQSITCRTKRTGESMTIGSVAERFGCSEWSYLPKSAQEAQLDTRATRNTEIETKSTKGMSLKNDAG